MQDYSNKITLMKNARGCYDLDTTKGCTSGMANNTRGCYGECYAYRGAKIHGFNFNKTVLRGFENIKHLEEIRNGINNIDMPFVRIGVTGDPSENWEHTIRILKLVYGCDKLMVIVTKHWKSLTVNQLKELSKIGACINTSLSALDSTELLKHRLLQYKIIKDYCKSVLRIVSCDFNKSTLTGLYFSDTQEMLFDNENVIDTILRVSINNTYVRSGLIRIKKVKFLDKSCFVSRFNKNTFFGKCSNCLEMCGI